MAAVAEHGTGQETEDVVVTRRHDGWAELVLNRPERRNAIVAASVDQLLDHASALAADEQVHAVVLRGEGGVFCSGLDLHEPPRGESFARRWKELHLALASFPVVLVGALERAAVAGGASLAFACDLLVVGEEAFLTVPEIELGRPAPMNVAWLVAKHGPGRALEVVLGARRYRGHELVAAGLATEAVADADVRRRATELAVAAAAYDRSTVVQLKDAVRAASPRRFAEVLDAVG